MLQLAPLKPKIAGALKTQLSNVALHKHSVRRLCFMVVLLVFSTVAVGHLQLGLPLGKGVLPVDHGHGQVVVQVVHLERRHKVEPRVGKDGQHHALRHYAQI